MKKLGLETCRGMDGRKEFDAAGVDRISGCLVYDTTENICMAS